MDTHRLVDGVGTARAAALLCGGACPATTRRQDPSPRWRFPAKSASHRVHQQCGQSGSPRPDD
ncbi:hypothetical protein ABTK77_19905, partial [Acinetobacter baumannii]